MWLIHFLRFSLEKCGKMWKNPPFFRADVAGLGKYCMGGYGRIGVYRVKLDVLAEKYKVEKSLENLQFNYTPFLCYVNNVI